MRILDLVFNLHEFIHSWFSKAIAVLLLLAIIDRFDYYFVFKQIKCKVTEKNGRIRYTHFRDYRRRGIYKLHQINGRWEKIDACDAKITTVLCKQKKILHFDFSTKESKKLDSSIAISQ